MSATTIIVFLGLAGFGVWLLYGERKLIRLGWASYKWASTEGTVVDSYDDSFTTPGIDRTSTGIVEVEHKETAHVYEYRLMVAFIVVAPIALAVQQRERPQLI